MTKKFKLVVFLLIFIIIASATLYVAWHVSTPKQFQLDISNESDVAVSKVMVFGMGAYKAQEYNNLAPGQFASLLINIKEEGDLRFSVEQAGNKIDHSITRDVAQLKHHKQWLTISPGYRFIINHVE